MGNNWKKRKNIAVPIQNIQITSKIVLQLTEMEDSFSASIYKYNIVIRD